MAKAKPNAAPDNAPAALTVERAALVAALNATAKVVETRNTYPILANVHLHADNDRLHIRATDLDIEISTSIPATGSLPATTAPAKTLLDIAKRASGDISLELDGEQLVVKSGRSRFKLAVIGADSFPDMAQAAFGGPFDIDLGALFGAVSFAQSDEQTRYYLNGVYLHAPEGRLRAVATDGHRLAAAYGPDHGPLSGIIVPRKTVGVVPDGQVSVEIADTKIRITKGDTVLVSKLIEGSFPDYERVIPKQNDRTLAVDRAALVSAVDRVGVMASDRGGKAVRLDLASGAVTLSVTSEDGNANDELAAEYESEPMTIGFNARYLADQLRAVTGENAVFLLNDASSPTVVTGDNPDWVSVLMPMRVGGGEV